MKIYLILIVFLFIAGTTSSEGSQVVKEQILDENTQLREPIVDQEEHESKRLLFKAEGEDGKQRVEHTKNPNKSKSKNGKRSKSNKDNSKNHKKAASHKDLTNTNAHAKNNKGKAAAKNGEKKNSNAHQSTKRTTHTKGGEQPKKSNDLPHKNVRKVPSKLNHHPKNNSQALHSNRTVKHTQNTHKSLNKTIQSSKPHNLNPVVSNSTISTTKNTTLSKKASINQTKVLTNNPILSSNISEVKHPQASLKKSNATIQSKTQPQSVSQESIDSQSQDEESEDSQSQESQSDDEESEDESSIQDDKIVNRTKKVQPKRSNISEKHQENSTLKAKDQFHNSAKATQNKSEALTLKPANTKIIEDANPNQNISQRNISKQTSAQTINKIQQTGNKTDENTNKTVKDTHNSEGNVHEIEKNNTSIVLGKEVNANNTEQTATSNQTDSIINRIVSNITEQNNTKISQNLIQHQEQINKTQQNLKEIQKLTKSTSDATIIESESNDTHIESNKTEQKFNPIDTKEEIILANSTNDKSSHQNASSVSNISNITTSQAAPQKQQPILIKIQESNRTKISKNEQNKSLIAVQEQNNQTQQKSGSELNKSLAIPSQTKPLQEINQSKFTTEPSIEKEQFKPQIIDAKQLIQNIKRKENKKQTKVSKSQQNNDPPKTVITLNADKKTNQQVKQEVDVDKDASLLSQKVEQSNNHKTVVPQNHLSAQPQKETEEKHAQLSPQSIVQPSKEEPSIDDKDEVTFQDFQLYVLYMILALIVAVLIVKILTRSGESRSSAQSMRPLEQQDSLRLSEPQTVQKQEEQH